MSESDRKQNYWLDDPGNVSKIAYGLYALCGLLFCLDFTYHKHVHFEFESWIGFYGAFGFVSCVGLVLAARLMRRVVRRDEDYYA